MTELERFHLALSGLPLGQVACLASVDSTNNYALRWGQEGAPDMSVVYAEEQTAGRGRGKRQWFSHPGTALTFSVILRLRPRENLSLGRFAALGALAVCSALEEKGLTPQIKWPNDVLLERRKVCGILVESLWDGEKPDFLVIGIGVNVLKGSVPPEDSLLFPATSLEQAGATSLERPDLLRSILVHLLEWRKGLRGTRFVQEVEKRLAFRGERVMLVSNETVLQQGILDGLHSDGSLRLVTPEGRHVKATYGEIHLRPLL